MSGRATMSQPDKRASILVVDDEEGIQRALKRVLSRKYHTDAVGSGEEAIRKLEKRDYDIAIVDLRMPEMDGFQLLRTIKLYRPETEVIIMSGSASEQKLIEAIRDQAFYFVTKPFQKEVIETLVERCVWTQRLERENLAHTRQLERFLEQAKEFQASLLPAGCPSLPGISCGVTYMPSEVLGGDFYDFHTVSKRSAALVIADVFGHGVLAAMRTGIVKSLFANAVREDPTPAHLVQTIDKAMNRFEGESPLTLFYGMLNLDDMSLSYANAGHPGPVLFSQNGGMKVLRSTASLLGAKIPLPRHPERKTQVAYGDALVLYTDGVLEAVDADHRWFGLDNLTRVIREHSDAPASGLAEEICRAAKRFARGGLPSDDMTAMVLQFEEPEWPGPVI
jgi:sigma-B regulation protein RsbU (phosphoserine phosphatase)